MKTNKTRYKEPAAAAPEYAGAFKKRCTVCGRMLPDHPDFYGIHAVREYRYRRPECRSCRAAMMRDKRAELREIDAYIENEGA